MRSLIIYSLLSCAALAAPLASKANGNGRNKGGNAVQAGGNAQNQAAQGQGEASQQEGENTGNVSQAGPANTGATNGGTANAGTADSTPPPPGSSGTPTPADLATAVANWNADTSMVSSFLNTGAGIMDDAAFKQAAEVAFNAEVDELIHKAIIDSANGNQPNVQAANSTLVTGGAFQDVVDKLKTMSIQGRAAIANIDLINQNRCVNVLPNIDTYMASTGSPLRAVRPLACDMTGVSGGVQGNGPTLPGQTPGTPQAAFQAAQALNNSQTQGVATGNNGNNGNGNNGNGNNGNGNNGNGNNGNGNTGNNGNGGNSGAQGATGTQGTESTTPQGGNVNSNANNGNVNGNAGRTNN